MERRSEKLFKFLRARLSPQGFLGLYVTLGLLVLLGAVWLFAAIAEDVVTGDPLTIVDARFSMWLHARTNPTLTRFMLLVTNLHSTLAMIMMTLALAAYLWARRFRYWVLTLMLSVIGGLLLNVLLKNTFLRPRPRFDNPIVTLKSYSFPSGHTLMATVFYGTLCAFLVSRTRDWKWRNLVIGLGIFLVLLVGFSRIYLGAHYLSDVLAAMAEGAAWLAICFTSVYLMRPASR